MHTAGHTHKEPRPSTYAFLGWSLDKNSTTANADALKAVTADRNVYAAFSATVRTYNVYFYNDAPVLKRCQCAYGGATYTG